MMYLMNFIYDLTNSNAIYYILLILLAIVSIAMLYLMYTQNKEISKQLKEKNDIVNATSKEILPLNEVESLDDREELVEISRMSIPQPLEYTQTLYLNTESMELQDISNDIEKTYKDRQNDISTYEEEQEESAIISYDELLSKTQAIPKVVDNVETKNTAVVDNYTYEENYLNRLKNLRNNLK